MHYRVCLNKSSLNALQMLSHMDTLFNFLVQVFVCREIGHRQGMVGNEHITIGSNSYEKPENLLSMDHGLRPIKL